MKKHLTSYFSFSKKELNGILVLFVLITLIFAVPYCYRYFAKPKVYDFAQFQKEIALFKASAIARQKKYASLREGIEENIVQPKYFEFDPNTASAVQWNILGLSPKQVKVVKNYLSKGGKFYKNDDLKKIYSISQDQYRNLEPFIKIKSDSRVSDRAQTLPIVKRSEGKAIPILSIVELNSADSIQLDQIRGIGPAFASRIIRFRNRLGGFHSREQLKEVYGMDSMRYSQLEKQIRVDGSTVLKVNLNAATFEDLRNHPYLNFNHINAIIQYRKQHGNFANIYDLKKVLILNDEIIRKIEPYLYID